MNRYETMVIIDPTLDQEKIDSVISRYTEMIKTDGEIITVDQWGKKRLAYPIKKKPTGYYVLYKYTAGNKVPQNLVNDMNINSSVLRYMTLVIDKNALKQEELDIAGAGRLKKEEEDKEASAKETGNLS